MAVISESKRVATSLAAVLEQDLLRAVYQPIVDIDTREVVAFEALARGPEGSPLERPDLLFDAARRTGRLQELDWACRAAAVRGAVDAGFGPPLTLFLNVEPEALGTPPPPHLAGLLDRAQHELALVVECTERAITSRPAELLSTLAAVRRRGWAVAVDDVGADPGSLALMPFLRPDVVKLDLRLVQQRPSSAVAEIVSAVNAEAERSGACVLAEGIETEAHAAKARAMGATLGQGWLYGRPGPLPQPLPSGGRGLITPASAPAPDPTASPYDAATATRAARPGDKRLLIEISKHLERQALTLGRPTVVVAAFQEGRFFTPPTARRYADLAGATAFVSALGEGMAVEPAPGVRGAVVDPADPVRGEWDLAVVGPHFAGALVARDLGDDGPDLDRRFDFVLTYEREAVVDIASSLLARVAPA
jgi:EAL domain-containing protein (putative c-di-GMP-specific phosphodiesterase class I)